MTADEKTSLLQGDGKKKVRHSINRFGIDVETPGVKPTRQSIGGVPKELEAWGRQSTSAQAQEIFPSESSGVKRRYSRKSVSGVGYGGVTGTQQRAPRKSMITTVDGMVNELTPVEMGRKELYEGLPFLAMPGMQKKTHNMSVAFSSFAAALDTMEEDEYLSSTTGKHMDAQEKEMRKSRMSVLLLDELEADATKVTTPLIFAVLIASLLQFNVGYNIGVMNAPEPFVFPGHSTSAWSMAVAAFCVAGPFGSVYGGKWADSMGRRGALLVTTWLFIAGGLIQAIAPSINIVILGRLVIGFASGVSSVLVPIYLGELAPPNLRGVIGTMTQFSLVIGIFVVDLVGFLFANDKLWRCMFLLISVMAFVQLVMTPLLLESPRWLLQKDPDSSHARFVIKKLRGFRYDDEIETEVDHYLGASKMQSADSSDTSDSSSKKSKNITAEMFADKKVRLMVVSTLVLQIAQQLSGINAVFYYSGLFFDGVIDNPLIGTTLMGGINVVATYGALLLMDKCGRKTLIMWSCGGMFFSCVVIVLSLKGYLDKMVALVAVASYVCFFEIGLGPIPSLMVAEMFDAKYVTAAMSVSSQVNWVCNFLVGLFFPAINESLGAYSFAPFAVVIALTFFYAWIWLPETQGTTPEELQASLVEKNAGTIYQNIDIEGSLVGPSHTEDEWAQALAELAAEGV